MYHHNANLAWWRGVLERNCMSTQNFGVDEILHRYYHCSSTTCDVHSTATKQAKKDSSRRAPRRPALTTEGISKQLNILTRMFLCQVNTWISNTTLILHQDVLLHVIISAAQRMLKEHCRSVGGLLHMAYKNLSGEVVHNGCGHWLTITNIGAATFRRWECLYPSKGTYRVEIAVLLCTLEKDITVSIMDIRNQSGTCDCGLFTIAVVTSLGGDRGAITFDQSEITVSIQKNVQSWKLIKVHTSILCLWEYSDAGRRRGGVKQVFKVVTCARARGSRTVVDGFVHFLIYGWC